MTRFATIAAAALSLLATPASATEPGSAIPPGGKDAGIAFAYSFFGTAIPCVASSIYISSEGEASEAAAGFPILAAYLGGPSLGHFYAGRSKRALIGIGIRSAAAAGFAAGLSIEDQKHYDAPSANTLMLLSVLVGLSSVVVDVFDAPRSARIHNRDLAPPQVGIGPAAVGPSHDPGLRVTVSF